MQSETRFIPLYQIDDANTDYRISTASDPEKIEQLRRSIAQTGMINPPLLIQQGNYFVIVAGFQRIEAARLQNAPTLEVRILPASTSVFDCVLIAIADNTYSHPLNLVEQSRAIGLLADHIEQDEAFFVLLDLFQLPSNPDMVKKMLALRLLPKSVQAHVANDTIAFPMAVLLSELDGNTAVIWSEFFFELQTGLNKQRECFSLVNEIAKRENLTVPEMIRQCREMMDQIITADKPQQINHLRTWLKNRRYPAISRFYQQYQTAVETLKLPIDIRLDPPPHFEDNCFSIQIRFTSANDFESKLNRVSQLLGHDSFLNLINRPSIA